MDCEQALRLISAQLDREIKPDESSRLESHLQECTACASALDALQIQDAELRRAYEGCWPSGSIVAERTIVRLRTVATPHATTPVDTKVGRAQRYFRWTLAAAVLLGVGFGLYRLAPRFISVPGAPTPSDDLGLSVGELDYLTPRRLPPGDLRPPLAVGEQRQTGANERQRIALPDGSVVYLNQNTRVRLDADRRLNVESGEVFVEVAPAPGDSRPPLARSTFVVRTAQREVTALGTKFGVKVEPAGTSVVVTQGKVEVSGVSGVLSAGQQLRADGDRPDAAQRASVVLDWLREPIAAAESPLVPRSQHSGGSLIAVDPWGQEAKLSLRNYHVDVHIEDGFARTTIDQTYFNHNAWRMEGTFYFPLPPDASLSRLAMYVADGKECNLMEGGMAERDYARNVFEQIVTRQKDPALLEWLDGSTFKMRVFPLEGRQEKRIILSYVQRLDSLYGRLGYRFPGGHNLPLVARWSANIRVKNGADLAWSCAGYPLDKQTNGKDLVLTTSARDVKPDRDLALELRKGDASLFPPSADPVPSPSPSQAEKEMRPLFSSSVHEGARYLMVRYRPNLTSPRQVQRRDWVFLFESSGDRDPLLARAQIEIIRTLLNNAGHEDTFAIVQAGTRCRVLEAKQVTPDNVKAGLEFLDKAHLIGALDLGTALREAVKLTAGSPNPTIVHVGSGIPALGLRNENELAKRVPDQVPYVGVGVGKRWARNFMKATAERTGGAFTQINPDESIGWRSFELFSLLNTPRLMNVKVIDDMERVKFLTFNSMVAQGEEVCAIARVSGRAGDASPPVPTSVTIDGTFEANPFRVTLPVADVRDKADYLPRAWAKLEIDRLVAEDKDKNKEQIVDLSKKMYVMSPFTSLLVLENEQMYEQFKVDRGRKDHWALYPCPAKIPTVYEPDPSQGIDVRNAPRGAESPSQKPTIEQVLSTIVVRVRPRLFARPSGQQYLTAAQLASGAYAWGTLDVPPDADPDLPTNNVNRIEEVTVPGPVVPNFGMFNGTPMNIPPPPGFGFAGFPGAGFPGAFGGAGMFPGGFGGMPGMNNMFGNLGGQFGLQGSNQAWLFAMLRARTAGQAFTALGRGDRLGWFDDPQRNMENEEIFRERWGALPDRLDHAILSLRGAVTPFQRRFEEELADQKQQAARMEVAGEYLARIVAGVPANTLLYQRPTFGGDPNVFSDLIAYAPAMNTRRADILAVLDAEARPDGKTARGTIDPTAARLIANARTTGWQSIRVPGTDRQPAFTVIFDGAGRFTYDRVTADGLRERAFCDGTTLWHLYPDLHVGAQRACSRYHHAELAALVPWALPAAEDLAWGCNLTLHRPDTVRIVPRDQDDKTPHAVLDLVFADGRLVERRFVEMPSGKVLSRETYSAAGLVTVYGADGKKVTEMDLAVEPAEGEPRLTPNTTSYVVLSLPYRAPDTVVHKYKLTGKAWPFDSEKQSDEALLEIFAAWLVEGPAQALDFYRLRIQPQTPERKLGFAVLLHSAGISVENARQGGADPLAGIPDQPLVRYLKGKYTEYDVRQTAPVARWSGGDFVHRLAALAIVDSDLAYWKTQPGSKGNWDRELDTALEFIRSNKATPRGWAVLSLLLERVGDDSKGRAELLEVLPLFDDLAGIGYASRYEYARLLMADGRPDQARDVYRDLYRKTLDAGVLPAIDGSFRKALQLGGKDPGAWHNLVTSAAQSLIARKQRFAIVALASQCRQLEDAVLADNLVLLALKDLPEAEKLATTLAAIEYYLQNNRTKQVEKLLDSLLRDEKLAKDENLWFLAANLASRQRPSMRSVQLFDKALDLQYRKLPDVINVQQVRQDYGWLLAAYQEVVSTMTFVDMEPPRELVGRVVRAADRWRSLDPDPSMACQAAVEVLKLLGEHELAWEYLTTPTALSPNEAAAQLQMAQTLVAQGSYDLADKAFVAAFEAESTDPEILMQRAQALRTAGKNTEARKVYRQIAEGTWQPRFQWLQQQARQMLQTGNWATNEPMPAEGP